MNDRRDSWPGQATRGAELTGLEAFVAIARTGTVAGAASELGRTQPSISHRLGQLERRWATRLFRRVARGMQLTPEGSRLLPRAEALLAQLEELDREAGMPVTRRLELRIGAGDALGRGPLPRALRRLTRKSPGIEVYLREGPRPRLLEALREGEIDLALVVWDDRRAGEEGLDLEPWLVTEVDLLSPASAARRGSSVALESLDGKPLVVLQSSSGFRRHVEQAFRARGLAFRPAVEVGNLSLVRRFVAAGLGVAPVPGVAFDERDTRRDVARQRLRGVPALRYGRARRAGAPLSAATLEFLAELG